MEQVKNLTQTALDQQQPKSSSIDRIEPIPREKQEAMGDIIDRWRLNLGWNVHDDHTQAIAIQSWVTTLDRENVPHDAYGELYDRALVTRATQLANGRNVQNFGVEYLLAEWVGPSGLRMEWSELEIHRGRTLTSVTAAGCEYCKGSGFRTVGDGRYAGVTKCDHQPLKDAAAR